MLKNIIFVCTGNTCRSPMAEMIAKHYIKKYEIKDVIVSSAGLCADVGQPINELAKTALQIMKIDCGQFSSKQFEPTMADNSAVICMTANHKQKLLGLSNIFVLGQLVNGNDITDPFGCSLEKYLACCAQLNQMIDKFFQNEIYKNILKMGSDK